MADSSVYETSITDEDGTTWQVRHSGGDTTGGMGSEWTEVEFVSGERRVLARIALNEPVSEATYLWALKVAKRAGLQR